MKQLRDDKAATQQKCCSPAFLNASENVFSCKPSTRARCYTIFLQSWQTAAAPPVGYPVQPLIAWYKLIGQNICHALVSPPRFYCSLTCHHFCRLTDSHIRKWSRQFLTTLHHSHAVLCILVGTPTIVLHLQLWVTFVVTWMLDPFSKSKVTMSVWPSWEAKWSGVTPCLVKMLVSAP